MKEKQMFGLLAVAVMMLAVFAALTPAAAADDTIAGDRAISPTSLPAGDTFRVTVDVAITGTVHGPVLNEDIPTGWTIAEVDNAGATYNAAETKWLWSGEQTGTKTVVYDVTVPAGTADANYPVTGTVLATVSGSGIGPFSVTGASQVTVTSGSSVTDTITGDRAISPTSLPAGDTFRVTVDVAITGTVYGPVLNEDIPTGWTVTEIDNAGATYNAAETKWLWGGEQTTDMTVVYDVTVPNDAADGTYDVTGTVLATIIGSTIVEHDVAGVNQVIVADHPCDFCIDLEAGWNLVSVPKKINGTNDAATVFDLDTATETCEYYCASTGTWMDIADIDVTPCRGFWVYKASSAMVCMNFTESDTSLPPVQQLYEGWNMIGHINTSVMPIDDSTTADFGSQTGLEGKFTMIYQWTPDRKWDACYPSGLNYMTAGQGYWIWMNEDAQMPGTP